MSAVQDGNVPRSAHPRAPWSSSSVMQRSPSGYPPSRPCNMQPLFGRGKLERIKDSTFGPRHYQGLRCCNAPVMQAHWSHEVQVELHCLDTRPMIYLGFFDTMSRGLRGLSKLVSSVQRTCRGGHLPSLLVGAKFLGEVFGIECDDTGQLACADSLLAPPSIHKIVQAALHADCNHKQVASCYLKDTIMNWDERRQEQRSPDVVRWNVQARQAFY